MKQKESKETLKQIQGLIKLYGLQIALERNQKEYFKVVPFDEK